MFFITFSSLWSFSFFLNLTYSIFIFSLIIYLIPIQGRSSSVNPSTRSNFSHINSFDFLYVLLTPLFIFWSLSMLWTSPTVTAWFGHVIFSAFSYKILILTTMTFAVLVLIYSSSVYYTSQEVYDYIVVNYSLYYWVSVLFLTNSVFTMIFGIEVLSTLIFLLIITSTYSSNSFYNNLDLSSSNYQQSSYPFSYLQSLLYFFWISLIASLSLFLFLLYFYTKILTFDWYLVEYVFVYFINVKSGTSVISLGLVWFIFVVCVFLKCGVAPLYIWKPTFFKGLPLQVLFVYVCFYYFFLFLFIIHFLVSYLNVIFYYFVWVQTVFLFLGLFLLLAILCETFYLKSFLALSSILNSLFVLLAINATHSTDILLWL